MFSGPAGGGDDGGDGGEVGGQVSAAVLHVWQESWWTGFAISEFDPAKLLTAAVLDQARKRRKRSPEEVKKIEAQRKAVG